MTTENIDIRIREDGAVVVRRNIESIAPAAERSAGALDFLKKALLAIGGAAAAREVLRLADSYTTLLNRLRSTGLEAGNLTGVYQALLKVSNDTRSSVEGSIELYSRLATSSKELGVSQQQLIEFTKSLNQAVILSGASAIEAENAIIQLSQGLASGTLRGDELRSVMEQLPAVADVIAKSLGVTRGQLRKMGEEGKITGQVVLRAFQEARGELADRFAKTVPTLSQSFQVLKNNLVDFVGRVDASTGITAALSKALYALAQNLDTVVYGLLGLVSGLVLLGGTQAIVLGVASAVRALTVAIAANPIGFLLVVITSAIVSLTLFRDKILLGIDGVTTLGDLLRAFGEKVGPVFTAVADAAEALFGPLIGVVRRWFAETDFSVANILRIVAKAVDFFVGAWRGAVYATVAIFEGVPPALSDIFTRALNFVLSKIALFVNKAGELLSTVTEFAGLGTIASNFDFTLENKDAGAAERLGTDIGDAFSRGFNAATPAQDFLKGLVNRSVELGQNRKLEERFASGTVSSEASKAAVVPLDSKEVDKARNALRSLLNTILPSVGAVLELAKAQETLREARAKGLITGEQELKYYALAQRYYEDAINPLQAVSRAYQEQMDLMRVAEPLRDSEEQYLRTKKDLQRQGIDLSADEEKALRSQIEALRALTEVTRAQDDVLRESAQSRQKDLTLRLDAIAALRKSGAITPSDANVSAVQTAPDLFAGTSEALAARVAAFKDMYSQIELMRVNELMSEESATLRKSQLAMQLKEELLQAQLQAAQARLALGDGTFADAALASLGRLREGFTSFSAGATEATGAFLKSFTDGFADSIGRAIVYSDNLSDALGNVARTVLSTLISALVKLGIQWLINAALGKAIAAGSAAASIATTAAVAASSAAAWAPAAALASLATLGANAAPASAGILAAFAVSEGVALASLAGFKDGGFTGMTNTNAVAGLVHGQEFVVNAEATSRNRPMLERMNAGGSAGTGMTVNIQNYGTSKDFEVQQLSETEIRIIARDEAKGVVREEAPTVVAGDIQSPNSRVSKALSGYTTAGRRR